MVLDVQLMRDVELKHVNIALVLIWRHGGSRRFFQGSVGIESHFARWRDRGYSFTASNGINSE